LISPHLKRYFYSDPVTTFLSKPQDAILGELASRNSFNLEITQRNAWQQEIIILKRVLSELRLSGQLFFEYSIPRLGRRIDVVLLIGPVIFILEFKVGDSDFHSDSIDQVWDYGLDLKNFHETSHNSLVAPILIATCAQAEECNIAYNPRNDRMLDPILCNQDTLINGIKKVLEFAQGDIIDPENWSQGRYHPTPTIIEAATALYNGHSVDEISRSDADAMNLSSTCDLIDKTIIWANKNSKKAICFVTGVPGAGKTLVGLKVATEHVSQQEMLHSVFLSGNGPLVDVLREALASDNVQQAKETGNKVRKPEALSAVKKFIQNVHHFRDECLTDTNRPPIEHVTIFDEAQRAWDLQQTKKFMETKKQVANFNLSEPEYLISCLDRHPDWAVIVCLVGGGQEINTGEAGISEWIQALIRSYPDWHIFISPHLADKEYNAVEVLNELGHHKNTTFQEDLHLRVSMRSFRAENVSLLVKNLLDLELEQARENFLQISEKYPIVLTRDLGKAKKWLKANARGSERYGIVVSSEAQRLKPHAIDVRTKTNPVHWFLKGKADVRSSYYLEDVATEFQVQGLELDWTCVTWDADFRRSDSGWAHWSFCGDRWNKILKSERQKYQLNAYRVLLTRARQGMVIVVPNGDIEDPTRKAEYYDPTFEYLSDIGLTLI
jgi:hypothetical protein